MASCLAVQYLILFLRWKTQAGEEWVVQREGLRGGKSILRSLKAITSLRKTEAITRPASNTPLPPPSIDRSLPRHPVSFMKGAYSQLPPLLLRGKFSELDFWAQRHVDLAGHVACAKHLCPCLPSFLVKMDCSDLHATRMSMRHK